MNALISVPFLRILFPFLAGICFGIYYPHFYPGLAFTSVFIVLAAVAGFAPRFKNKFLFLMAADCFLFLYAFGLAIEKNETLRDNYYGNFIQSDSLCTCVVVIDELPVAKPNFIKCSARVIQVRSGKTDQTVQGPCLLYFRKSTQDSLLKAGAVLHLRTQLKPIPSPLNPYEFDYKNYLAKKQIIYSAFVAPDSWCSVQSQVVLNPLWMTGLMSKNYVLRQLKLADLSPTAYAICCALLTGYDDEIDQPVLEAFSHSGTLHVLSVSGLHTGLLYLALSFLFDLADPKRTRKRLRFIVVTIILWGFALLTGFPSPVLRAVVMFNLLGLGKLFFRDRPGNQLNILLASAFALLCFNPFYLTDIGFLLSYFAMGGLICFQPGLSGLWQPENFILKAIWQSVSASVAATISTLPLTLFIFKQFPLWFFISNIVVIPATFVMLLLALLVLLHCPFSAMLVNFLMRFLNWFISFFDSPDYGFIDRIDFRVSDVVFLSLLTLLLYEAIRRRNFSLLRWSLIVLIAWQSVSLCQSFAAKESGLLSVYALKNKSCISIKNKNTVALSSVHNKDLNRYIKPHLTSFNYPLMNPKPLVCNFINSGASKVLLLNRPGFVLQNLPDSVSILVLSNNFDLKAEELRSFKGLKTVVMDGSNKRNSVVRISRICKEQSVDFHFTGNSGAFLMDF